jgi:hypothetical protein
VIAMMVCAGGGARMADFVVWLDGDGVAEILGPGGCRLVIRRAII